MHPVLQVGKRLEEIHGTVGLTKDFVREAYNRRGLMGFVLSPGKTKPGDQVLVYPPVR
jgi:MOSC domain-containing protein YiiM